MDRKRDGALWLGKSCWCDARHRTKRALRQNVVILPLRQQSRKQQVAKEQSFRQAFSGPVRNPRVLKGTLRSEERAESWQKEIGPWGYDPAHCPWLSAKYSPSPYTTLVWDSWPATGLQQPHKLSFSLKARLPVAQPLSFPLLTTSAQTKATGAPTFQFSFPPHLCMFHFLNKGWAWHPQLSCHCLFAVTPAWPQAHTLTLCLLSHLDQVVCPCAPHLKCTPLYYRLRPKFLGFCFCCCRPQILFKNSFKNIPHK